MLINPWLFPNGKTAALTMSYDDGTEYDEKLIDIFNRYGIKGSFHIDGRTIKKRSTFFRESAKEIYKGHEISVHTLDHPHLQYLPDSELMQQILMSKEELEDIFGYSIRGMSYPYGNYDERVKEIARICGIKYSRTCVSTRNTNIPNDFLEWHPSCHHNSLTGMLDLITNEEHFSVHGKVPKVLYVWGHSYEFNSDNNWNVIEKFCKSASEYEHIWYATNIEIYDYITATRNIEVSVNRRIIFNPSRLSVWVEIDGNPTEIKPGENLFIDR